VIDPAFPTVRNRCLRLDGPFSSSPARAPAGDRIPTNGFSSWKLEQQAGAPVFAAAERPNLFAYGTIPPLSLAPYPAGPLKAGRTRLRTVVNPTMEQAANAGNLRAVHGVGADNQTRSSL